MNTTQSVNQSFKQQVRLQCYGALASAGFTRFRKEGVDWPLADGFHCWVGLNTAMHSERVEINPFVGVHVAPIEKLWTRLKVGKYPSKYDRGIATYSLHLGELAGDEQAFNFDRATDVDAEATRLARLYSTVGVSYAKSIASYAALLPLLQERSEMLGAYPERIASCLYLMGRKDEARSFVDGFCAQHKEYFEGFSVPFIQMLNSEGIH